MTAYRITVSGVPLPRSREFDQEFSQRLSFLLAERGSVCEDLIFDLGDYSELGVCFVRCEPTHGPDNESGKTARLVRATLRDLCIEWGIIEQGECPKHLN